MSDFQELLEKLSEAIPDMPWLKKVQKKATPPAPAAPKPKVEGYISAWKKNTVLWDGTIRPDSEARLDPNDPDDAEYLKELDAYKGQPDYSVNNMGHEGKEFWVGAPYRKEVSPDGGSFQAIRFEVDGDGKIIPPGGKEDNWVDAYEDAVTINGVSLGEWKKSGKSIFSIKPEEFADVYNEVGMMY